MSACISLSRLFAASQLKSVQSCISAISLQFSRRRFCLTNNYSQIHCCRNTVKTVPSLRYQRLIFPSVLKSEEASWQSIAQHCGFYTSPQRLMHPLLWLVIRPLAKVATALTGRWMHVFLLWLLTPSVPCPHWGFVNPLCRAPHSCAAVVHWCMMYVIAVVAVILWILLTINVFIYLFVYLFICLFMYVGVIRPHRSYSSRLRWF